MGAPGRSIDVGSAVIMAVTALLFGIALFVKGFTHDLLLEGAVFLVSVKLVVMAQKNAAVARATRERLEAIHAMVERLSAPRPEDGSG